MTTDGQSTDSKGEGQKRLSGRSVALLLVIVVAAVCFPATVILERAVDDWRNGCQNRLHPRANPVNAASVLRLPIPAGAMIPTEDLRTVERDAPFGYRADVLMQRAESTALAAEVFDELCQDGWSFDGANQYDRSDFTYGGEGDNRFCAAQVVQQRFYMGYVPLCGSSRHYTSYVNVQRGDVVFAGYESASSYADTGRYANEALSSSMIGFRLNTE